MRKRMTQGSGRHWLPVTVVVLLACAAAWGQTRRDEVTLITGERLAGKVLSETLKGVELDRDLDGQADTVYPLKQVKQVVYGDQPRYLLEATLLRTSPERSEQYVAELKRAYTDRNTKKWILQHAYYELARRYEEMSGMDEKYVSEAINAYEKLLKDIPETRYAVQVRLNLAGVHLYRGDGESARQTLRQLMNKGFGPDVETRAAMLEVRTYLLNGQGQEAQKLLDQLKTDAVTDPSVSQEIEVLRADAQMARGEYQPAYDRLVKVLDATVTTPQAPVRAEAYVVLGDQFRLRDRCEEAMLAYLRVHLMYPELEATTRARALLGATLCFRKLNRPEEARDFRAEVIRLYPGSVWQKKVEEH